MMMRMRTRTLVFLGVLAVVLLISVPMAVYGFALHGTESTVTLTVKDKAPSTGSEPYRVFATDGTTYSVQDSIYYWNFRASDRYGALEIGRTYSCSAIGWRLGFLSAYRNLISCRELGTGKGRRR